MPLNLDADQNLKLELTDFIGESVAVLGIKGSGKTNSAAVIIEELVGTLPLTIIDLEGEYWGLKERFDILVVGDSEHADLPASPAQAAALATFSITEGVSVILDMSNQFGDKADTFLVEYFKTLFRVAGSLRKPYQVIVEEAHEYVPQSGSHPVKEILTRIALRGRKRGLGLITISQRSAKVNKDILTQAEIVFLHRVVHPRDMAVYFDLLPLQKKEVENRVRGLETGQALVMHNFEVKTAQIRLRHTYHAGATPGLDEENPPELRKIDATLLDELRETLGVRNSSKPTEPSPVKLLETQLEELQQQLMEKDAEIERLMERVAILSGINVQVEATQPQPDLMNVGAIHTDKIISGNGGSRPSKDRQQMELFTGDRGGQPYRSPLAIKRAVQRQQKLFNHLIRDLNRCPKHERIVLSYFIERPDLEFSIEQLARYIGYSVSTLRSSPPTKLLKLGLIDRQGKRGDYRYKGEIKSYLSEHFPDLDRGRLEHELLEKLHV